MIRLSNVSLLRPGKEGDRACILRNVSMTLPTKERLAVIGDDLEALTEVLLMLAGMRKPDVGEVRFDFARPAPVINVGSFAGRMLVGQLTIAENIRAAARMHGVDETALLALVETACEFGSLLEARASSLNREMRRRLEATLIAAIPFDCYYIDRLHEFEGKLIWQFMHVTRLRGAGFLFTSRHPNQIRKFAEAEVRLTDTTLELSGQIT